MKMRFIILMILAMVHTVNVPTSIEKAQIAEDMKPVLQEHIDEVQLSRKMGKVFEKTVKEENLLRANRTTGNYNSSGHLTMSSGVYWYGNQKETYYNLNMSGVVSIAHSNGIEGEYWVREDGCKMLGDYIILACNRNVHPYGSIVWTSLGMGISLDTGGFAHYNSEQVDIAVSW